MKKKFAIIIVFIGIVSLGIGVYLVLKSYKNEVSDKIIFELIDKKYVENCLNDNCNVPNDLYAHLSYNSNIDVIDSSLKSMNGNTDYYYEYVTTSNFDGCEDKKLNYAYRKSISNEYYNFVSDDYITFAIERVEKDFCSNKTAIMPVESYIYDKNDERMLSQDEFQNKLGYKSKELDEIITNYLEKNNKEIVQDSYYGKALYYKSDGKLYLSFSINEEFMSILVK